MDSGLVYQRVARPPTIWTARFGVSNVELKVGLFDVGLLVLLLKLRAD